MVASFLFYSNKKKKKNLTNIWIFQDCSYMFKFKIIFHQRRFLVMWITIFKMLHFNVHKRNMAQRNIDFTCQEHMGFIFSQALSHYIAFLDPIRIRGIGQNGDIMQTLWLWKMVVQRYLWVSGYHTETSHSPLGSTLWSRFTFHVFHTAVWW